MKNLWTKILAAQKEIRPIVKDVENTFYKSSYFNIDAVLEEIMPIMSKVGLVVLQPETTLDGKPALETIIADPESGEFISKTALLNENPDVQKFGSGLTYQRRYCLTSFLCLQGEKDDDGNEAVKKPVAPVQKQPVATKPVEPVYANEPIVDTLKDGDVCTHCAVGFMKLKNGSKGRFLGCSEYPNCTHTVSVK